jgi:hypothetical protein
MLKIKNTIEKLIGEVCEINRNVSVYVKDNFISYTFQAIFCCLDYKTKKIVLMGILRRKNV